MMVDDPGTEGKCSVVIAMMQEHRRSQRHLGVKTLQIGFTLYKVLSHGTYSHNITFDIRDKFLI